MFESIPGVASVELLRGASAGVPSVPDLLVEVPHGAERRADFDRVRARLVGDLPPDLHVFFHVNTDVGAWAYGRRVAERVLAAQPHRSALVIRSEIPRTFIDCNRLAETRQGDLTHGGLTAGLAPYVRHPADRALLLDLHAQYVGLVERAFAAVCGAGGFGLVPHTYGPRNLPIRSIDDDIAERLREVHVPEVYATCTLRPEIDLLTRDGDGREMSAPGLAERLVAGFAEVELSAEICRTYHQIPGTMGHVWASRYPGRTLCLEVRRDLLVDRWMPFEEMTVSPAQADRAARPIAAALLGIL